MQLQISQLALYDYVLHHFRLPTEQEIKANISCSSSTDVQSQNKTLSKGFTSYSKRQGNTKGIPMKFDYQREIVQTDEAFQIQAISTEVDQRLCNKSSKNTKGKLYQALSDAREEEKYNF